jgi:diacylglycerol kinase family enzyme
VTPIVAPGESTREAAAYWAYRGLERLAMSVPERVGRRVFSAAGALAYRRMDGVRATVAANQARVLGLEIDDPRVDVSTREAFDLYARYWLDSFRAPLLPADEVDRRFVMEGSEAIDAALEAGADLVAACGGDGTVRCVAQVLAGTGTALGLVPAGTGNLLARNLDVVISRAAEIAPDDAEAAMRVALTGDDRRIDIGWVTAVGPGGDEHERPEEKAFLVMAGMGFDARIMANAPEALKAKVGPIAYVVSGLQHFNGDRVRVRIEVDGSATTRRVRTVVVGNVGRLQGGLTLMPDAAVDDGWLDLVAIGPRGIVGWLDVAGRLITQRRRKDANLQHWRGRSIVLAAEGPQPAQLDGDPIGDVTELRMRVDEGALLVRVAAGGRRRG